MSPMPARRWGDDFQLLDLLSDSPGSQDLAVRDFALLTIAARLVGDLPGQLVFKGGFVLRHAYGVHRFSKDIDATKGDPPERLDAELIAGVIRDASIGDQVRFRPGRPATDSQRSLDFDAIEVSGALIEPALVQVEVSYREGVVDPPEAAMIGEPYYEPFEILHLQAHEASAEKLRTLAQRTRPTDLADLAVLLRDRGPADSDIARVASKKFELVRRGAGNRADRVERNLRAIGADYDDTVPAVFPDAPSYHEAMDIVWPRVKVLIP